jgi:mannosyltransferase OCH1-like enzyme
MNTSEVIPRIIWQTWHTKNLPPKMRETIQILKQQHPGFKHYLYDIPMCRNFIRKYFRPEVLEAYDSLIPYAFKSDLWRLCVLYIHGGIYLDTKFKCVNGFRLREFLKREHYSHSIDMKFISNGFMVCRPMKEKILKAINYLVSRIKKKSIHISGPPILGKILKPHIICDMKRGCGGYMFKGRNIITEYEGYRDQNFQMHWTEAIKNNRVFKS